MSGAPETPPELGPAALGPADLARPLWHRFARVAAALPTHPALLDADGALSYAGLLSLALRYGGVIAARVPAGAPVALCLRTSRHVVAAMLGALFAGRPYVPLDPGYPADHLRRILGHSAARLLIGDRSDDLAPLAVQAGDPCETVRAAEVLQAPIAVRGEGRPESPAYVIYTSGSTGAPKGVWQDQRGLLHDILQYTQMVHPGRDDRHSLLYSPCVNGALRDIFGAILNGATLCMSDLRSEGLHKVLHDLAARRVTILHAMPPVLRSLIRGAEGPICPEARLLYTAGDRFLTQDLQALRANLPAACEIYTGIGSTECATLYRQWIVPRDFTADSELVPVGYPVEAREMRLVDAQGAEVAAGEIGQIRVTSPHVARGYWNDAALTQSCFVEDPARPGWRSFQPGDLGRLRPDGLLDFLGRADRQIKIRGFRIEPAEIEAVLRRMAGVAEAVIVPRTEAGRTRLIAFVEPDAGVQPEAGALRRSLCASLPPQLHPERVVVLERLPRLGNFKLDVKALQALTEAADTDPEPRTGLPADYLSRWEKILKRPVDPDATLEALGADSLELLELELLLERDLKISVRGLLLAQATPRRIWAAAGPAAGQGAPDAHPAADRLHALAALMAPSPGIPLDPDGLVRLHNHGGQRMPLLWCVNQVSEATALARALGPDQPLLAMRSLAGLDGGAPPTPGAARQVAERYIQILLARDLPLRVAVGGNCQAAPFAFQIATALSLEGYAVASLILLERMLPVPYGGRMLMLFGRDSRTHNPAFQFADPTAAWGSYLRDGHCAIVEGSHGDFFVPGNVASLAGALRAEIDATAATGPLHARARRAELSAQLVSEPDRRVRIRLRNPTGIAFEAGADSHIALAIHALDIGEADTRPLRVPDRMIPLPARLAPGETLEVSAPLPADRFGTGRYLIGLCEEGVGWFTPQAGADPVIEVPAQPGDRRPPPRPAGRGGHDTA